MLNNIKNNMSFGSLKIMQNEATKKAITRYIDCMDTARVMSDSFEKIRQESGNTLVAIRGKILNAKDGESILFETYNTQNSSLLGQILIKASDFLTSRADLFEKFGNDTLRTIKSMK